jgi:hypothetical protein
MGRSLPLWGPIFELMGKDCDEFCKVTVNPEIGTIVWPNGADLAPEVLRADAVPTCDTEANSAGRPIDR